MSGCDGNSCVNGSCSCGGGTRTTAEKNQQAIERFKCPVVIELDQLTKFMEAERDLAAVREEVKLFRSARRKTKASADTTSQ